MALHYILDGYNIIHQFPEFFQGSLEESRRKLIQFIENTRPQGSRNNRVTIVFDGQGGTGNFSSVSGMNVFFASPESADERIKGMVDDSENRKNMVVVSDDREIQCYIRKLGARSVSVESFLVRGESAGRLPRQRFQDPDDRVNMISLTAEHKINREFAKIWLKKKN